VSRIDFEVALIGCEILREYSSVSSEGPQIIICIGLLSRLGLLHEQSLNEFQNQPWLLHGLRLGEFRDLLKLWHEVKINEQKVEQHARPQLSCSFRFLMLAIPIQEV
jgi:hypothetical protein